MSQASQQVGGAGVAAPPSAAAGATTALPSAAADATVSTPPDSAAPSPAAKAAESTMSTPHRLRLLSRGVVVVGLVIGVIGALICSYLAVSLSRAKADMPICARKE